MIDWTSKTSLLVCVVFLASTKACTTLSNMATGSTDCTTWNLLGPTTVTSITQPFTDSPTFSEAEKTQATCEVSTVGMYTMWTMDLGDVTAVSHLLLLTVNSSDSSLDNSSVQIRMSKPCCQGSVDPTICYDNCTPIHTETVTSGISYDVYRISCDGHNVTGRYLQVILTSDKQIPINVCGFKVIGCRESKDLTNLALNRVASQSTLLWNAGPQLAVDGSRSQVFLPWESPPQCSHTDSVAESWWQVDLNRTLPVSELLLYNRADCCDERLNNFEVDVGNQDVTGAIQFSTCTFHPGPAGHTVYLYCHQPVCGRYLRITKQPSDLTSLTLCEVEIYFNESRFWQHWAPETELPVTVTSQQTTTADHTTGEQTTAANWITDGVYREETSIQTTDNTATANEHATATPAVQSEDTAMPTTLPSSMSTEDVMITTEGQSATYRETSSENPHVSTQPTAKVTLSKATSCKCYCLQRRHVIPNSTITTDMWKQAETAAKQIAETLTMNTSSTGSYSRKRSSASDERMSAQTSGYIAVVVMVMLGLFLMGPDVLSAIGWLTPKLGKLKQKIIVNTA